MNIKMIVGASRPWQKWVKYWGLSYLIDDTILFDTFCNEKTLLKKLKSAKVDLTTIQAVVISHEHWDHIGGLWGFLVQRPNVDVYVPPSSSAVFKDRIRTCGARVIDKAGIKQLKENIWLTDEMVGHHAGKAVPEQSIVMRDGDGLTLVVGCSHPGIMQIVQRVKEDFGGPVRRIFGGFHLFQSDKSVAEACAGQLEGEGLKTIAPTHCTGWGVERMMKRRFGSAYTSLREGKAFQF